MTRTIDGHTQEEDGGCIHNCPGCKAEAEYAATYNAPGYCRAPSNEEMKRGVQTFQKLSYSTYGDLGKACYALALTVLPEAINIAEGEYDTARNRVLSLCLCWYDITVEKAIRAINEAEKQLQDWGVIQ